MLFRLLTFFILIMASNIYALDRPSFLNDINTSFSNDKYSGLKNMSAIKNIDTNKTLTQALKDYKQLFPVHLNSSSIFDEHSFEELDFEHNSLVHKYHYRAYYYTSLLYTQKLNQEKKDILANKIIERNFKDLYELMIHSTTMIDYIYAFTFYKDLYDVIPKDNFDVCSIMKNNPPPLDLGIFYEKVELEKQDLFRLTEASLNNSTDFEELGDGYESLMLEMVRKFKLYYNSYEDKYILAMQSGEQIKIDEFHQFLKQEEENRTSTLSSIRFAYEGLKVKLLSRYGYDVDSNGMADHMGEILALVAFPKFSTILDEHKRLIQQYEKQLLSCDNKVKRDK